MSERSPVPQPTKDKTALKGIANFQSYLRKQPTMLALLLALAVLFFLFVTGLSRAYHAQRESLGDRWFSRGVADLKVKRYDAAVTKFRAALLYSRDNYSYQLNLAEALIGLKRTGEASAYLLNLWDREPEDGLVNLELARIASQNGQTDQAIRYYHNAVYAAWPSDQEIRRRDVRLELIELLLRINAKAEAQAELIALAENVGADAAQQEHIGQLFLRAQDYEHALAAFHASLKSDRHNPAAMAGAGYAAFELGRYPLAESYLETAVSDDPNDRQSDDRLKTAKLVLRMDPFRRQTSLAERNRMAVEAFETAGLRLKNCAVRGNPSAQASSQSGLSDKWASLQPQVTERNLQRNPDLVESVMDIVFRIERQTSGDCGTPTGKDLALLLIAKLHEGT
jgi:tetratricopeptide (TPR) repeat protein